MKDDNQIKIEEINIDEMEAKKNNNIEDKEAEIVVETSDVSDVNVEVENNKEATNTELIKEKKDTKKERKKSTRRKKNKKEQKARDEKKNKKKNEHLVLYLTIGVIVVIIVILLSVNILIPKKKIITIDMLHRLNYEGKFSEKNYLFNGYSFVNYADQWWTRIKDKNNTYDIPFRYGPKQTLNVSVEKNIPQKIILKDKIYLTIDKTKNTKDAIFGIATLEVARVTGKGYNLLNIETVGAYTAFTEQGIPVVTCKNVSKNVSVVVFKLGNKTRLYAEGDCVIVEGSDNWEVVRAADRLVYEILRIFGV